MVIVPSHFLELSEFFKDEKGVKFCHFDHEPAVDTNKMEVTIAFPHKKEDGPLTRTDYAVAVARAMQFDERVIRYAQERLYEKRERRARGIRGY